MIEPQRMSWRNSPNIAIHPAAEWFPLLPADELDGLAADIRTNRLREKVAVITKGARQLVIDGRNRLDALERAGFTIVDERGLLLNSVCIDLTKGGDLDLVDPAKVEGFIISKNIYHRHLSIEQKRELAARLLKADPERSNRAIAAEVKLDKNTVQGVRQELEASSEIHQSETRVSASGQKRTPAKKSAPRVSPEPAEPPSSDQPTVGAPANVNAGSAIDEPQDQPTPAAPLSLRDLPFDLALATVKEWLAALPISQQSLAVEALGRATGAVKAELTVAEQDQVELARSEAEPAQPEGEPAQTTPGVQEVGDRVSLLVARFNALPGGRQKWCRDRLDKPEDAINHLKNNPNWSDARAWLTAFIACAAKDQAAVRAQVEAAMGDVEAAGAARQSAEEPILAA